MKLVQTLLIGAALAATAAPALASNDVEITNIRGYGDACKSRSNGSPINWAYTIRSDRKSFSVDFSDFIADKKQRTRKCTLLLNVKYPPGKTVYDYSTQFRGEADVPRGEKGQVTSRLRLGSGNWQTVNKDLSRGADGDWNTRIATRGDSKNAPCGGRDYTVTLQITAQASAKSFVSLESGNGGLSRVRIKSKDCE